MTRTALPLVLIGLLTACGGAPASRLVAAPTVAPAGAATLTVHRTTHLWGFALVYEVALDGKSVANLGPGGVATLPVASGQHTIDLFCGGGPFGAAAQRTIAAEPGRNYELDAFQTMNSGCALRPTA